MDVGFVGTVKNWCFDHQRYQARISLGCIESVIGCCKSIADSVEMQKTSSQSYGMPLPEITTPKWTAELDVIIVDQ